VSGTAGGAITVSTSVTATTGDVSLNGTSIQLDGMTTAGGDVTLNVMLALFPCTTLLRSDLLTADATGTISVNTSVNSLDAASGGDLTVTEANAINLTTVSSATGNVSVTAGGAITVSTSVTATTGDVSLNGTSIQLDGTTTAGDDVTLNATAGSIAGTGLVTGDLLTADATGNISVNTAVNSLDASSGGDLTVTDAGTLDLTTVTSTTGDINVTATDAIAVSTNVEATAGDVILKGTSIQLDGTTTAGGGVTLNATTGSINGTGLVTGDVLTADASNGSISLRLDVNSASASGKNDVTLNQTANDAVNFTSVSSQAGNITLITAGTTAGKGMTLGTLTAGSNTSTVTLTGGVAFTLSSATNGSVQTSVPVGTVVLSNAELLVSRSPATYNPPLNSVFTLIDSPQNISGTFNGYANDSSINVGGVFLRVNYTTDVTLTANVGAAIYVYSGWTGQPDGSTVTLPTSVGGVTTAVLGYNAFTTIAAATTQAGLAIGTDAVYVFAGATSHNSGTYPESVTVDSSISYTFEMGVSRPSDAANATMAATAGPALTLSGTPGTVTVTGGVFGTSANAATLQVSAGDLTLRGASVSETSAGAQAGLNVSSNGTIDLGTAGSAGNNTFLTQGAGNLITLANTATNNVSALGNAFTINGTAYTQPLSQAAGYAIENAVVHKMDTGSLPAGLVTWTADNVYVTTATAGVQRGVDVSGASGWTVNVNTGTYNENVSISKPVTILGTGSPTIGNAFTVDLNAGSNLGGTASSGLTARTVNVNTGANLVDGIVLVNPSDTLAVVNWADMLTGPASSPEGSSYTVSIAAMPADALAVYAATGSTVLWGDATSSSPAYTGAATSASTTYTDNGNYVTGSGNPGTTNPFSPLTARINAGTRSQIRGTVSRTITNVAPTSGFDNGGNVTQGSNGLVFFFGQSDVSSVDTTVGFRYSYDFNNDGTYEIVNSLSSSATVPASYLGSGTVTVAGRIMDKDGGFTVYTTDITVTPVAPTFSVSSLTTNASGVDVVFSTPLDPATMTLYTGLGNAGAVIDVTLVGSTVGAVKGSAVWNPATSTLSFVRTGTVLAADTYTFTLKGGASGLLNTTGQQLVGTSGVGSDYVTTFTVSSASSPILTIADFARGAGQPIDVDPADLTSNLPITISNAAGILAVDFTLTYDPSLMTINSVAKGSALGAAWSLVTNTTTPGILVVSLATSGLAPLSGTNLPLVVLDASVPSGALYESSAVLRFTSAALNAGGIAVRTDNAVEKAVFLGDADGSKTYTGFDSTLIQRVVVGLDTGFAAHRWTDPVIVANATGTGTLNSLDATYVAQTAAGFTVAQIPALPGGTPSSAPAGIDPNISVPSNIAGSPGATVNVPVTLTVEPGANVYAAGYTIVFDATKLTLGTATLGAAAPGWNLVVNPNVAGQVTVVMYVADPPITDASDGVITNIPFTVAAGAAAGTTPLDVTAQQDGQLQNLVWTDTDGSIQIFTDPPKVTGVYVDSVAQGTVVPWSTTFRNYLASTGVGSADLGYLIPTTTSVPSFTRENPNQLNTIPWTNVNRIRVTFSEDVGIASGSWSDYVKITGINTANYTPGSVAYGQVGGVWTATWTLSGNGVFTSDKLMVNVSGNITAVASGVKLAGAWTNPTPPPSAAAGAQMPSGGATATPGQNLAFRVNMLPGAVGGGTIVTAADVSRVRAAQNTSTTSPGTAPSNYTIFKDLNGSGVIEAADVSRVRALQNTQLPGGEPSAASSGGGFSMFSGAGGGTKGGDGKDGGLTPLTVTLPGSTTVGSLAWAALGTDPLASGRKGESAPKPETQPTGSEATPAAGAAALSDSGLGTLSGATITSSGSARTVGFVGGSDGTMTLSEMRTLSDVVWLAVAEEASGRKPTGRQIGL